MKILTRTKCKKCRSINITLYSAPSFPIDNDVKKKNNRRRIFLMSSKNRSYFILNKSFNISSLSSPCKSYRHRFIFKCNDCSYYTCKVNKNMLGNLRKEQIKTDKNK